jgi:hypothetical protein
LHLQKAYNGFGYSEGDFPAAEAASREILSLPMFPGLTEEQQAAVVGCIHEFIRARGSADAEPALAVSPPSTAPAGWNGLSPQP